MVYWQFVEKEDKWGLEHWLDFPGGWSKNLEYLYTAQPTWSTVATLPVPDQWKSSKKKQVINLYEYTFEPLGHMMQRNMQTGTERRIRRLALLG
eukprot:5178771-Amphidinium_carterae.2